MWISKKKHYKEVLEAGRKARDEAREMEQFDKLWELEDKVTKLQKKIRKLEDMVKNGY